jgi:stress response protein SCP2
MKNITKGQKLSLEKELPSKSFVTGLKWNQSAASDYEIDVSIMMLSERGKLEKDENFVFYNNLKSECGGVIMHENPVNDYKKSALINTAKIASDISRLLFVLTIDNGDQLNQRFENVKNITAEIADESGREVALQYNVEGLTQETAVIVLEIYKHNNEWKLQATGNGFNSGLAAILKEYGSEAVQVQEDASPAPSPTPSPSPSQDFTPPKVSSKPSSKVPVGSADFIKDYNARLSLINQQLSALGLANQKAQVAVALDLSCSMGIMLRNGTIQDAFDRIIPLAIQIDDDGNLDVFPFHDEAFNHNVPFTLENRDRFIQHEILFKYHLGGAKYAPVINKIAAKYSSAGKGSDPVYVTFFTDGDCEDAAQTESAIKEASSKGIFWQFIGIGGSQSGFAFLNKLDTMSGRRVDNANFCHIEDLNKIKDDELYKKMLKEFPDWLRAAKQAGIIN